VKEECGRGNSECGIRNVEGGKLKEGEKVGRFESRKIRSCEVEGVGSWEAMEFGMRNSDPASFFR